VYLYLYVSPPPPPDLHSNKRGRDNADTKVALAAVRELRSDENSINYFISHSWHDDVQAKFAILDMVKQQFKAKYGREATFWLDKVCIDQENISDGLKVLCINVTACKKLLVVCGKTYFQRLWCMLELFIMFAFSQDEAVAAERIELIPIEADGVTRESILESMSNFELEGAHCYDPNEEIKLRSVMAAVGEAQFVARMQSLAGKIRARERESSPGNLVRSLTRSLSARHRPRSAPLPHHPRSAPLGRSPSIDTDGAVLGSLVAS